MEFFCLCCLWVQKEFNYVPNKPLRDSGHLYFRLSLNRGGRVWLREWWREDWSALVVPDTDGQDERGAQAQLRPCSVEYYKTRSQRAPALHWWHWLFYHSVIHCSHQEPLGHDSPTTVASRLKVLLPSEIKRLLGYAKSVSRGVMMVHLIHRAQMSRAISNGKMKIN